MFTILGRSTAFGVDDADLIPILGILKGRSLTPELTQQIPYPVPDTTTDSGFRNNESNYTLQMNEFVSAWKLCGNL